MPRPPVRLAFAIAACLLLRHASRRSGVTDAEVDQSLPGDDYLARPMLEWNRATTIHAPPERVWPWLVQMGFGRGGWYTSERFDRLVWHVENKSAETILPEYQDLAVGDIVPDGPEYAAYFRVAEVIPHHAIVYTSIRHPFRGQPIDPTDVVALERRERELLEGGTYIDFSWAFVLRPLGTSHSRLMIRTRATYGPWLARLIAPPLGLVDLFHVSVMFRKIRRRAETQPPP